MSTEQIKRRPRPADGLRAARLLPGRPDRRGARRRGRHRLDRFRRRHRTAGPADLRRGGGAHRGAAGASPICPAWSTRTPCTRRWPSWNRPARETAGAVRVAAADAAPALGAVRQAVDESRQLWMRYYTASRDALTERIVDPIRLLVTDGHAYLEGVLPLGRRGSALPGGPDRGDHGARRAGPGPALGRLGHSGADVPPGSRRSRR